MITQISEKAVSAKYDQFCIQKTGMPSSHKSDGVSAKPVEILGGGKTDAAYRERYSADGFNYE